MEAERFWARVDLSHGPGGCWTWEGAKTRFGHGRWSIDAKRKTLSHRYSWECVNGAIPSGLCVLHRCDVPACVNPAHLFIGTQTENVADRDSKRRQSRGDEHGTSKLTEHDIIDVRSLFAFGATKKALAMAFGVDPRTIRSAISGETWGHVR